MYGSIPDVPFMTPHLLITYYILTCAVTVHANGMLIPPIPQLSFSLALNAVRAVGNPLPVVLQSLWVFAV